MLYATVRQRKIHVKTPVTVIQNGVNVDHLVLDMDDEWREMTSIVCVFTNGDVAKEMLHTFGETVLVPWECLQNTGRLSVSCTGYVGSDKVMTTMMPDSFWNVVQNGPKEGDTPMDPTPSLYEQVLSAANAANAAATQATELSAQLLTDKANGVFDGEPGAPGDTPYIGENANWWIGETDTGYKAKGEDGTDGIGIVSIDRTAGTGAAGTFDTYTITYTNNTTSSYKVYNGADGNNFAVLGRYEDLETLNSAHPVGNPGDAYAVGSLEENIIYIWSAEQNAWQALGNLQGPPGIPGVDGVTPHIGENGNWWIGETDTGVSASVAASHASTHAKDGYDPVTPKAIGALPTEGGTVTQTLQFDRAAGAQGRGSIYKYNTSTADYGTRIKDEAANGNAFTLHLQAKDNTATLIYKPSDGEENKYKIYHEGNKPTAEDVGALANTGGTVSGTIEVTKTTASEAGFRVKNSLRQISYIISANNNAGVYDMTNGKWVFQHSGSNNSLNSSYHTPPTSNGFRQSKLVSADTNPSNNGDINWTYG